ncbi:tail fiber protein [Flavivirga eckloniae]|uniref:Peptidase S74 domain-containing protein n=1 Tax=Flavivirga eckloniae TaxID=1803846 RepID=A0A2K9PRK4_9FLAO|nr:tail fiber protein [Flavivirga eckloniae]AUP79675.1 hypothetical protein C1H87_13545 [Flavivirga eckloniae]
MKKQLFIICLYLSAPCYLCSQNIFPTTGNVGIGTNNPRKSLEIEGGDGVGFRLFNNTANTWDILNTQYGKLDFVRGNTSTFMRIDQFGNVGIGTKNTGNGLLTLNGNNINLLRLENDELGKEALMRFRSRSISGGTLHSDISLYATGNNQGYLGFKVPSNNTINSGYDMIINQSGNVGIGTTTPDSKLTVKGKVHAQEVKVTVNAGADFVFEDNYDLPDLEKTEAFIKKNKHLPEIASEKDMQENGLLLAEMNIKLLQKIEELTLYTIQQEKRIKTIEKENTELKKQKERIALLEEKIALLLNKK